jgi:TPR repeat protein
MNRRIAGPLLLAAAGLLLLCSACGQTGVMLVAGHPPAPGTVLQDENAVGATRYLVQAEVCPDGSVRLVRHLATNSLDSEGPPPLDGVPLLWRASPQGWTVAMEHGAPTQPQAETLKTLVPPFATEALYPAQPVHLGERWNLSADAARALLSRLAGVALSQSLVNDPSGWMELSSLADRDGQRCATLRFEVRVEFKASDKQTSILLVNGDAVRSLSSFQDLTVEAKAEWTDPGKPAKPYASASFHRSIIRPDAQPAEAMFKLGEQSFLAQDAPHDYVWARQWYQKAAEAGHAGAMNRLGEIFILGMGAPKDESQAFAWFSKSAEAGNANAMAGLGDLYQSGRGVAKDYAKAREWYQKAAEAGNAPAMVLLSEMYEVGLGGARDYAQAFVWLQKAAEGGDASAMGEVGVLYETGLGVAQDYAKACEWYRKGAEAGDPDAMLSLGFAYFTGQGVAQDYAQARPWIQKAAAAGDARAMYNMGVLYSKGYGVAQDYTQARQWYQKAVDRGNPRAVEELAKLPLK